MLYLLIIFGFNNQLRFNKEGKYNLPVGKRDFNKEMRLKLQKFSLKLQGQNFFFTNKDFKDFVLNDLDENSFIYADPPYLITTATYNENGGWTDIEEKNLINFLNKADSKGIKFALSNVIKHKGKFNNILQKWIDENELYVNDIIMNYNNSNYHAKNKEEETKEVLITNYNTLNKYNGLFDIKYETTI